RFYRVVAAMYAAGVPAGQALEHASKAAGNLYLTSRLNIAVPGVRQGEALSDSLIRTKVIPPTALEMIKTGDQTGNLDSMLEKAAEYSENEAQVATVQLTVIGGVLLFLGIAAYIGMFIANFYASYYSNIMKQP
ncbi:MAG: type II secretion system F family protein, partial [Armatimonadota bacterium]|nr:type II secretion system F family protein [Armatimonadota bacterium]